LPPDEHQADTNAGAEQQPDIYYIGSIDGMERRIVERESTLPFRGLPAAALRGRNVLLLLRNALTLTLGVFAALRLLRELRPAAILGTGGYVCVPLFVAARVLRVPSIIYLPDVVPGLAVRWLARLANRVACSVEDSQHYLPPLRPAQQPLLVTGYPVRATLFVQDKDACRRAFGLRSDMPTLLVYGGSRGARSINRAIQLILPDLLRFTQIIHVCGREGDEVWLRAEASRLDATHQARYHLSPYLDNLGDATMVQAFGAADLALCRSGASTLAELPAAGLPAILVPYPYVHQDENADYLVRHGAAVKIDDSAMLGEGRAQHGPLFRTLHRLLTQPSERQHMAQQSRMLARPDAAHRLAGALRELATRRES
jgi:UDP-N-acetylglucosamine--N-acetylmuramyl-(pentapeptide) pyrophosphoryl-undecaprenol N-acetylglucosamine transferase